MMIQKLKKRTAFTMIELVFVIIVMGIIGKFGVEFVAQAYRSFIHTTVSNKLQSSSTFAVEFIATRLQHRIKASTIAREINGTGYTLLADYFNQTAPIIEWIGVDIDGFRGNTQPLWSGIIDLNDTVSDSIRLSSPGTETNSTNALIQALSSSAAVQNNMAIYFVDPDALPTAEGWGWDANISKFDTQVGISTSRNNIHPVTTNIAPSISTFRPLKPRDDSINSFSGVKAFEYYQLAWSAYAVGIDDFNATGNETGTLKLWYNYQPWKGDTYLLQENKTDTNSSIIMENVSSFRFIASDSVVKIQVCVKSLIIDGDDDDGGYSICKEKTVF